MPQDRTSLVLGLLLVALGGGWLLRSLGFISPVDWAWTLGLAVVSVLTIALSGFDKVSFVVGGFFAVASICSVLRQIGKITAEVEVPALVLTAGILLLIARSNRIPKPRWIENGDVVK